MNRTFLIAGAVLSTSSLLLVDSAIKGGVLLLLAALVAVLLRRDSAATRHLVWQVSIVGMLFVPVFSAVLPQLRILPAWAVIPAAREAEDVEAADPSLPSPTFDSGILTRTPVASPPMSPGLTKIDVAQSPPIVANQPAVDLPFARPVLPLVENISEPPTHQWSVPDALPILWLVGFSVLILRLMAARWMLRSGERRGKVIAVSQTSMLNASTTEPSDEAVLVAFQATCQQLSVRRPVRLLIHSEQSIPIVWGIIRLRLLLPENARTWSAEQLKSVLLHELAHIKRRDAIAQLLAQVACALHWFNPLVWFASWRLHVERERACDDLVLSNGVPPSAYAEHLLDVATRLSTSPWTQACGLAMARKSSLEGRLVAVLDGHSNRRSVSASVAALSLLVGFGVAVPIAMLRPTDASSAEDEIVVTSEDAASDAAIPKDSTPDDTAPNDTSTANAEKYGPDDWAGWFTNQVSHRRLKDGSYPSLAFKYLREFVIEDLSGKAKAAGDDGARAWLELTAAEQNWKADEFTRLVAQIATWNLTVVQRALPREEFASRCSPKPGNPATPEELRGFNFGPEAGNGLRVAWVLDPSKTEYAVGDSLKCRVVIHNSGSQPVQFLGCLDFQAGTWSIRDAADKPIPTTALSHSNVWLKPRMFPYQRFQVEPGHIVELAGTGVGIGDGDHSAAKSQIVIGRVIDAHAGDAVRIDIETTLGLAPLAESLSHPFHNRDEFPEEQARDWFGTLRSGEVKFTVAAASTDPPPAASPEAAVAPAASEVAKDEPDADTAEAPADELKPDGKEGQALFRIWQANARTDGRIPGAWVGQLGEWVKYFIELNDGAGESGELSAKFKLLLPRFDATHDWTQTEAVALLDDVGAVHRIPFNNALGDAAERVILPGDPLPAELKNVSWGRRDATGLRVAWYLQHEDDRQTRQVEPHKNPGIWMLVPSPRTYQLGSVFKSRILVHNSGKEPVFFVMPSWQQSSTHAAHDDEGNEIKVTAVEWTTMAQMKMYRLAPGAYLETNAPGIGVGAKTDREDWASLRPGAWIDAKEGDEVRLTPGKVEVRVSPFVVGSRHLNAFQKPKDAAELWDLVVAERVSRELPIPTGAEDREQLLRRVVRDLYDVDPTQSEIDAFVADKSPGPLHPVTSEVMLRDRVKHSRTMSSFTGTLPPGAMTFRVLAADPQARNRTRFATDAGYYILGDNQRLHVEQSRRGERRVNKATIRFFSPNPKTKPAAEPVVIPLPDGVHTFAIWWDRGSGMLWVTQEGVTRKYDFTNPGDVKETRPEPGSSPEIPVFGDWWLKNLPAIPALPSDPPPDGPKPTAGTKLDPGMDANFKWGEPVNGLRAALIRPPALGSPESTQTKDFQMLIQNVSQSPVRLVAEPAANNPAQRDIVTLIDCSTPAASQLRYRLDWKLTGNQTVSDCERRSKPT